MLHPEADENGVENIQVNNRIHTDSRLEKL